METKRHHRCVLAALGLIALIAGAPYPTLAEAAGSGTDAGVPTRHVDDATLERLRSLHYSAHEEVRLVLVPATVVDRKGRTVRDLGREEFQVWEDARPQEIRFFSAEQREPISITFMLDLSGSMRQLDKMLHAKEAIRFFVDRLQPRDRFALIGFADEQVAWITEFTDDREQFLQRLEVQQGYGQTALHDAVAAAPGLVDAKIKGRRAIVLITDGVDNFSQMTIDDAVDLARRIHLPIYTVGFMSVVPENLPKGSVETQLEILDRISDETGGRLYAVHDPDELKEAVQEVEVELRHQYLIGYYPTASESDGGFRQIRLEASRRRVEVRARSGYFAEP